MYLALGVAVLSLASYGWYRSRQRRLAAIRLELQRKTEAGINPLDDGFYCIMLKDGTCRSGYIERPPAE